ncbi:hypothetical protein MTR_7g006475 [Medicago truncatula]|uniref:Uncharacterized protein n=1 Tax=Medicago truncatula TaxID=3880 RepID=A0A072TVL1_MEDTR|nr:hypothetical protein MTR_7g006475 [Medicago truncatula]
MMNTTTLFPILLPIRAPKTHVRKSPLTTATNSNYYGSPASYSYEGQHFQAEGARFTNNNNSLVSYFINIDNTPTNSTNNNDNNSTNNNSTNNNDNNSTNNNDYATTQRQM